MHKDAPVAHQAAMAAHEQGRFWEYHDRLFAEPGKLKPADLTRHAQELALDMDRFNLALSTGKFKVAIDAEVSEATALGVTATPSFFVNGRFLSGAKPFEEFAALINGELKRQNLPVPAGAVATN